METKRANRRRGNYFFEDIHRYQVDKYDFQILLTGIERSYSSDDDYNEPGVEYQMATKCITNLLGLAHMNSKRPILMHMKTCGGIAEEGMAIYDAIRTCPNPITILSYAHARSMSSIILQAADKRVLMPNSHFMFHRGSLSLDSSYKNVMTGARWEEQQMEIMYTIYIGRLKARGKFSRWSRERIRGMLEAEMDKKEDVYLTAEQTVDWGFADEVFDGNWNTIRTKKKQRAVRM